MKPCPGCKTMHDDDYFGTCGQCGRGLGDTKPAVSPDFHLAQMLRETQANEAFGNQKELSPSNAPARVVEAARAFFPIEEIDEQQDSTV